MTAHEKLNYLEYAAKDLPATKAFFSTVFGWSFTDFGPQYTAFDNQGLEGGFYQADLCSNSDLGGALTVFLVMIFTLLSKKLLRQVALLSNHFLTFPGVVGFIL